MDSSLNLPILTCIQRAIKVMLLDKWTFQDLEKHHIELFNKIKEHYSK